LKAVIAGEKVDGKQTIAVLDKYSGKEIDTVPSLTPADVDRAVSAASRSAHKVAEMTAYRRREILEKVAKEVDARLADLSITLVSESGMCIRDAEFEVRRAANVLRMYAADALRLGGEWLSLDADARGAGRYGYYFRVPVGVVAAISAFNNPLALMAHKLGPASAAGNSVVFKPASFTPLAALTIASMFAEAGFPPEAMNIITGSGEVLGPPLAADPRVRVVTFTGGWEAGEKLSKVAGPKKLLMELGSNCPNIVCADADLEAAVPSLISAAYSYQGQNCLHAQRILVQESVYDKFRDEFVSRASKLRSGDPRSPSTEVGPMISEGAAMRVERWVSEAVAMGGRILIGGHRSGSFFEPTLMEHVPKDAKVSCEEVFGPVTVLSRFTKLADAIQVANETEFGLQAGIFTRSLGDAMAAVRSLRFGTVLVNESSDFRVDMMPFGGVKKSGLGREGAENALEAMTDIRMVVFDQRNPG